MARMIDVGYYEENLKKINAAGISNEDILPITYINSSAAVKSKSWTNGWYGMYFFKCLQNHRKRS